MVGLAQMVRASDCGPEGRRFDPDIPPQFIIIIYAGVVQRLVCKFSKLEIGFRLPSPAPLCLQGHFLFGSRTFGSTTLTRTKFAPVGVFFSGVGPSVRLPSPAPKKVKITTCGYF